MLQKRYHEKYLIINVDLPNIGYNMLIKCQLLMKSSLFIHKSRDELDIGFGCTLA